MSVEGGLDRQSRQVGRVPHSQRVRRGYQQTADRGERLDEAVVLLQRALKVEPENPSYLDSLGWAYFKQSKLELADPPLSAAAGQQPENSVIQDHLGDLRFRQGRFADAITAWERALSGDGDGIDRAAIEKKMRDARSRLKK